MNRCEVLLCYFACLYVSYSPERDELMSVVTHSEVQVIYEVCLSGKKQRGVAAQDSDSALVPPLMTAAGTRSAIRQRVASCGEAVDDCLKDLFWSGD